ncbi:MAG: multicopper oxidase family protein [Roseiarcus sp.]|jgi:FtsP/CotA-like multicopper oxidase with cupredoxin domain
MGRAAGRGAARLRPGMSAGRRDILRAGVWAALWAGCGAGVRRAWPAQADGFRRLAAGPATAQALAGPVPPVAALGYDGSSPGPLLRLRKGEALKVRLVNGLAQPTTLSWPGLRMPNAMAGVAGLTQPAVPPGASFDYRYTPPDSGFNLYRPHVGAATAGQIGRGLYGPVIVEESAPPACDLETIVALADWRLDPQGGPSDEEGGGGSAPMAANGGPVPLALGVAPGARVRLRLANAAVARIMLIRVEGARPLIVALDGQPAEAFEPLRNAFPMGPGARFDMMFDMPRDGAAVRFLLSGGAGDQPLLVFAAAGDALAPRPPLAGLPDNPLLPAEIDLQRARRIDLTIAGGGAAPFSINGATLRDWPVSPLFSAARGAPVTLGLINRTALTQAIRIHGHVVRLLHPLDDGWEPYWRDGVLIAPGKTSHVAFVADNPGVWPIESAIPAHAAAGVMTTFAVG